LLQPNAQSKQTALSGTALIAGWFREPHATQGRLLFPMEGVVCRPRLSVTIETVYLGF
jgi:hypothetical protein